MAVVCLATVYNIRKRISSGSSLRHKAGAGRPRTLRNSIKKSLAAHIQHNPHMSLRSLASNLDPNVSHETVRRGLKDMSYSKPYPTLAPMLNEMHYVYRVKWARKYKYPVKDWAKTIFVDEMSIWLARGRIRMWTKGGKKDYVEQQNIPPKSTFGRLFHLWEFFHSVYLRKT
ncbi:hypothetical protein LOD99_9222 [Oopsacas minuta]|uniref:Transposase Tc1-like domain-containing protein n=1 Tax=Oopsacas minuta TaxID=111878 RepID=A0AAV7JCB8_9METZ|nr:hypothetical protein LOD99_9222 [Oopsacas minuta]